MMGAFLHTIPYDGGESTSIPPVSPIQDASSTTATVPRPSIANRHVNRRLHMYANRKLRSSKVLDLSGPSYTPYHMMAESRPLYLLFRLIEDTSSTTETVPSPSIANRHVNRRLLMCANRKLRSSKLFDRSGPSYTPYHMMADRLPLSLLLRLIQDTSSTTATVPSPSIANRHVNRRLRMCANRKLRSSKLFDRSGPSYTPYHMMAESRPLYLLLRLIEDTSSTTETVPSPSIANRHVTRCLRMCDNRKLRSSKLFDRSGPSYTPYHMMAESRPLYLLLRLIRAPLRLQCRSHADPLLTCTSFVVHTCMLNANGAFNR